MTLGYGLKMDFEFTTFFMERQERRLLRNVKDFETPNSYSNFNL